MDYSEPKGEEMDYFWLGVFVILAGIVMGQGAIEVAWVVTRGVVAVVGIGIAIGYICWELKEFRVLRSGSRWSPTRGPHAGSVGQEEAEGVEVSADLQGTVLVEDLREVLVEDEQEEEIVRHGRKGTEAATREGGPRGLRRGVRIRPPVYYTGYCEFCDERGECARCMGEISAEEEQYSDGEAFCYRCRCLGHHGAGCPGEGESATRTTRKGSRKDLAVARGRRGG